MPRSSIFDQIRAKRRRRHVMADVVEDRWGVGLRFVATGDVVYLTGNEEERCLHSTEHLDKDGYGLFGASPPLLPHAPPLRPLFNASPEKRFHILRKPLAHIPRIGRFPGRH